MGKIDILLKAYDTDIRAKLLLSFLITETIKKNHMTGGKVKHEKGNIQPTGLHIQQTVLDVSAFHLKIEGLLIFSCLPSASLWNSCKVEMVTQLPFGVRLIVSLLCQP